MQIAFGSAEFYIPTAKSCAIPPLTNEAALESHLLRRHSGCVLANGDQKGKVVQKQISAAKPEKWFTRFFDFIHNPLRSLVESCPTETRKAPLKAGVRLWKVLEVRLALSQGEDHGKEA